MGALPGGRRGRGCSRRGRDSRLGCLRSRVRPRYPPDRSVGSGHGANRGLGERGPTGGGTRRCLPVGKLNSRSRRRCSGRSRRGGDRHRGSCSSAPVATGRRSCSPGWSRRPVAGAVGWGICRLRRSASENAPPRTSGERRSYRSGVHGRAGGQPGRRSGGAAHAHRSGRAVAGRAVRLGNGHSELRRVCS